MNPLMTDTEHIDLLERIKQLEAENKLLKSKITNFQKGGDTVSVPENIKPIFDKAEKIVGEYFRELKADPRKASIDIKGERYVLMRASSLSVDFLKKIQDLYADKGEKEAFAIGQKFLFDVAHVLGIGDAKAFHEKLDLKDPIEKLSAGPIHFAYTGWAFVDILSDSKPIPSDDFYLKYHHPHSFEADSWIRKGEKSENAVCVMNTGYSSGWCEESFGIPLTAVEISCRAKGDEQCTFIMAPPHKIQEHLNKESVNKADNIVYDIPLFFERKKAEEKIKASLKEKDVLLKEIHHRVKNNLQLVSSFLNLQTQFLNDSKALALFSETKNRVKTLALVHEKLYENRAEFVDIENYIRSIIELLSDSYHDAQEINFDFRGNETDKLHIEKAVPCGLIANELISNAFKHAFNEEEGIIEVCLEIGKQESVLIVKDNGRGLPENFNPAESESLGLEIVTLLTEQLDGNIVFNNHEGTEVMVTFKS